MSMYRARPDAGRIRYDRRADGLYRRARLQASGYGAAVRLSAIGTAQAGQAQSARVVENFYNDATLDDLVDAH